MILNITHNLDGSANALYRDLSAISRVPCVKSTQIQSFLWSVFSRIRTEYEDLDSQSLYSVRIRKNKDQKKLHIWTLFTQW